MNLTNKTALENFDLSQIHDLDGARRTILMLLNLIEDLNADNRALREEIQRLREVIARLQGVTSNRRLKPIKPPTTNQSIPITLPNKSGISRSPETKVASWA